MASPYQIASSSQRRRKYTELLGITEESAVPLSETPPLLSPPQQRRDFSSVRSQFSLSSPLTTQRRLPLCSLFGNTLPASAPMFPSSGIGVPCSAPTLPSSGTRVPHSGPMFPLSGIRFSPPRLSTQHSNLLPVSPQVPYSAPRISSLLPQHGRVQNLPVSSINSALINIESPQKKARVFDTGASSHQGASFLFPQLQTQVFETGASSHQGASSLFPQRQARVFETEASSHQEASYLFPQRQARVFETGGSSHQGASSLFPQRQARVFETEALSHQGASSLFPQRQARVFETGASSHQGASSLFPQRLARVFETGASSHQGASSLFPQRQPQVFETGASSHRGASSLFPQRQAWVFETEASSHRGASSLFPPRQAQFFETEVSSHQGASIFEAGDGGNPKASTESPFDEQLKAVSEFSQFLDEIPIPTNMGDDLREERLLVNSYIPIDQMREARNTINDDTSNDNSKIDEMNNWWDKVYNHDCKK